MATAPLHDGITIQRSFDAAAINAVCNHPEVLPGLSLGLGAIDISGLLADNRNIALVGEYGGVLFHWTGPGVYAGHDFYLPEGRGKWALDATRAMLSAMFDTYGARLIWAQTPVDNKACRMFNRWLGFTSEGVSKQPIAPGLDPELVETFVLERASCR